MNEFELRGYVVPPQDTYLSKVLTMDTSDDSRYFHKESRFLMSEKNMPILDFLMHLQANPHPNLLTPIGFRGEIGQHLEEAYPYIDEPLMDHEESTIRNGIKEGKLDERDLVDMMLQLTDALSYIHNLGYAHLDVRTRNIFIRSDGDKLHLTLFDYNGLGSPFFQGAGIDSWNPERPPELREGNVMVDQRFDVYAVGHILFNLSHITGSDQKERLIQGLDPSHPVFDVMRKAKTSLIDCYPDAMRMHDDLVGLAA